MLSIGKLAAGPGAGRYYVDQVAHGREDYYAGEGEAPGQWVGGGRGDARAHGRGRRGRASSRLLEGRDPASGALLRTAARRGAVAGFDLTFKAPKSVSILFGDRRARRRARSRARTRLRSRDALGYLEREACRARRGAAARSGAGAGVRRGGVPAPHVARRRSAAAHARRRREPTQGRGRALDRARRPRRCTAHAKTAGYLYQARCGGGHRAARAASGTPVEHGAADLVGVPREVIEHFSQRRAEIVEHMAARGEHSARGGADRRRSRRASGKDYDVPVERLASEWRARAAEHGLTAALERVLRRRADRGTLRRERARATGWQAPTGSRTSARRSRGATSCRRSPRRARDGAHGRRARAPAPTRSSPRDEIVELERRAGERRYTTRELLRLERELLERARDSAATAASRRPRDASTRRSTRGRRSATSSGELVVALDSRRARRRGRPRARRRGQDVRARRRARGVAAQRHRRCIGCALSARAALRAARPGRHRRHDDRAARARARRVAARCRTARVLRRRRGRRWSARAISPRSPTPPSAREAKLVLVGDDRQLPEIEAGGAFRALAERLGAARAQRGPPTARAVGPRRARARCATATSSASPARTPSTAGRRGARPPRQRASASSPTGGRRTSAASRR